MGYFGIIIQCQNGGNCTKELLWYFLLFSFSDVCDPNPCQNEGNCSAGVCACDNGYSGETCEIGKYHICIVGLRIILYFTNII